MTFPMQRMAVLVLVLGMAASAQADPPVATPSAPAAAGSAADSAQTPAVPASPAAPEPPPAGETATDRSSETSSAADEYVEQGAKFFKSKEFQKAAEMLQKAYDIDPKPILLFNIAQANRRAGKVRDALLLYQRFLTKDPHTPLRAETEGYCSELELVIAEEDKAERERKKPLYKKAWFWGVVSGGAAVVLGVGLGFGLGYGLRDNRSVITLTF